MFATPTHVAIDISSILAAYRRDEVAPREPWNHFGYPENMAAFGLEEGLLRKFLFPWLLNLLVEELERIISSTKYHVGLA